MAERSPAFHVQNDRRAGVSFRCRKCRQVVAAVTDEQMLALDPRQLAIDCKKTLDGHVCLPPRVGEGGLL